MKKIVGCILMIIGVAVGAGMLALPLASAQANFQTTLLMMLFSWSIMTLGALAILEVNLWLPEGANFISMANRTTGKTFGAVTWIVYLLLLYSLMCAYLSGTGDILQGLLANIGLHLPRWMATLFALLILGAIVIKDVRVVDIFNRSLMSIKLLVYVLLLFAVMPHVNLSYLSSGHYIYKTSTLMVMMTAFGFAPIVPTLRVYLRSNISKLKKVILLGSLFALTIYILWVFNIQGLVIRSGAAGLLAIAASSEPNTALINSMNSLLHSEILSIFVKIFISICALTSFLGVSLALTDFIADGLQYKKKYFEGFMVYLLTFLPPLIVVLFWPGIFIKALSYAGFCCIFLLILLPVIMLYRGRYYKHFTGPKIVPGGKISLILIMAVSVALIVLQI